MTSSKNVAFVEGSANAQLANMVTVARSNVNVHVILIAVSSPNESLWMNQRWWNFDAECRIRYECTSMNLAHSNLLCDIVHIEIDFRVSSESVYLGRKHVYIMNAELYVLFEKGDCGVEDKPTKYNANLSSIAISVYNYSYVV